MALSLRGPYRQRTDTSLKKKQTTPRTEDDDGNAIDDDNCVVCFHDDQSMFSTYQRPKRRIKSLKGVLGVKADEPGFLNRHPPARYTFMGLSPVEGNYHAKSLVKIPEPGFDRTQKGLSCGEALVCQPPVHWESARPSKSLFIPVRSSSNSTPRKASPRKLVQAYHINSSLGSDYTSSRCTTSTPEKFSAITVGGVRYKIQEHRTSSKAPSSTPVTTVTPISITLDMNFLRKDSTGED
ncbi:uncharacterized protein [Ptychodera flava]|uniref:uncharacterized protein n=1 Tax=Ptychodera flava TaxID=63121 RepID=UPI00396A25A8